MTRMTSEEYRKQISLELRQKQKIIFWTLPDGSAFGLNFEIMWIDWHFGAYIHSTNIQWGSIMSVKHGGLFGSKIIQGC